MGKPTINAKAVLRDIRNGATRADLMEKYKLSPKGLDSLYKKLVAAGLIAPGELTKRTAPREAVKESRSRRVPKRPAQQQHTTKPKSAEFKVSDQAKAIADDIKAGIHDNEILRRHEISPGQFREIKERLVQVGLLSPVGSHDSPSRESRTCPSCGHAIPAAAAKCNHCGEWLDDQATAPPRGRVNHSEPVAPRSPPQRAVPNFNDDNLEDDKECPWEERENYGTFSAFVQTATKCILTPTQFFSNLPVNGGYGNPILFAIFSLVLSSAIAYAWTQLFIRGAGFLGLILAIVGGLFFAAIAVPIGLFLWTAVLHVCLLLVGGARNGFEATFRVVSYASVASLFNAIPVVGQIISLWGLVLTVIGLRETHRTSTGKAVAAVAIPVVVSVFLIAVTLIMGLFAVKSAFRQATVGVELSGEELPSEVCAALQEFLEEVDFATGTEDPKSEQEQVQEALKSLNETLKAHKDHPDMRKISKIATIYTLSVLAQKQLKSATRGMMPSLNSQKQREKLETLCPE